MFFLLVLSSHYHPTTEIEGFFNLLYAHILDLWPVDSPETKKHVTDLLPIITSASAESAIKYRMYVFRFWYLLALLTRPPKPNELLQHAPTRISSPSSGLHRAPGPRQRE